MKRIGILGGTFDPPHLGHLIMGEEVRREKELDEIWFIPTYTPPHKDAASSSAEERLEMLRRATASNEHFKIDMIEYERQGKSYTIDTVAALKEKYPDTVFHFIIGADMVEYLPNWHRIDELVKMITFIGVRRAGYALTTPYPVMVANIPMLDVSSSMLRERFSKRESTSYFLPHDVYSYIKEYHLYE